MEYTNITDTVLVPKNTGVAGFLETIKKILQRPRVLSITVDSRGKVTYVRSVKEGEDAQPIDVEFDTLTPSAVIRTCPDLVEVAVHASWNPMIAVAAMFNESAVDQMVPIAFCANSATRLWKWSQERGGFTFTKNTEFFGLPMVYDDNLPDTGLFLCTAYERQAALVDTRKVYKITML